MNKEPEVDLLTEGSLTINLSTPILDCSKHGPGNRDLIISVGEIPTSIGCGLCYAEAMAELTVAYRDKRGISWSNQRVLKVDAE